LFETVFCGGFSFFFFFLTPHGRVFFAGAQGPEDKKSVEKTPKAPTFLGKKTWGGAHPVGTPPPPLVLSVFDFLNFSSGGFGQGGGSGARPKEKFFSRWKRKIKNQKAKKGEKKKTPIFFGSPPPNFFPKMGAKGKGPNPVFEKKFFSPNSRFLKPGKKGENPQKLFWKIIKTPRGVGVGDLLIFFRKGAPFFVFSPRPSFFGIFFCFVAWEEKFQGGGAGEVSPPPKTGMGPGPKS